MSTELGTKSEFNLRAIFNERAAIFGGALALLLAAGCGEDENRSTEVRTVTKTVAAETEPAPAYTSSTQSEGVMMTFDDLGGGDPTILVYPGVGDSIADKKYNARYKDGETVIAECKTEGRDVSSHPEVGEIERSSNDWVRIHADEETQYATAVYIENPQQVLSQLEDC